MSQFFVFKCQNCEQSARHWWAGRRQAGVLPLGVIAAFQLLAEFLGVVAPLRQPDQASQRRASVAVAALFGGVI
jgi:hypothetical protein